MKFTLLLIFIIISVVPIVFAEQVIISEKGVEYEIAEITEERKYRLSHIYKVQGFTTTGEMFFLFTSEKTNFEHVMLLDREGHWIKAEMKDKIVEEIIPQNSIIIDGKTEFHYLLDQYDQVYNNAEYKLFIKTFDKSLYSGTDFQNFEGKISGANISAMIVDPNGEIKTTFVGTVENGMFEGGVIVPENLWQRGWYTVNIIIEFEDEFYLEDLSFYVLGEVKSDGGTSPVVEEPEPTPVIPELPIIP